MRKELAMFVALLCMCGVIYASNGNFAGESNVLNTTRQIAMLGVVAIGISFVIITGGIDLSVGSVIGISGVIIARISAPPIGGGVVSGAGLSLWLGISAAMAVALSIGLVQGLLITRLGLQPFIVTLGGMLFIRGASQTITQGGNISFLDSPFRDLAEEGIRLGSALKVPYPALICLAVLVAGGYLLHFTVFGRHLYAIGGNREAAEYSGIPVRRVETLAYVISAGLAGLAGIPYAAYISQMSHSVGETYELYAITAAVLGGCSLRGGEGTVIGALIGAGVMKVMENGINMFQVNYKDAAGVQQTWRLNENWKNMIIGGVILAAVILDQVTHIVQARRRKMRAGRAALVLIACLVATRLAGAQVPAGPQLPGTAPLDWDGDIASRLVDAVDAFLLKEIDASVAARAAHWKRDLSSPEAYSRSVEPNRERLRHILGLRDARVPFDAPQVLATAAEPALLARGDGFEVFEVRWPAFGDVHGEGLLLVPVGRAPAGSVIAIPHCEVLPEALAGLTDGVPPVSQYARRLAESGCRVVVPFLIDRKKSRWGPNGSGAELTAREFLYRSAFELGRHLIGYEVAKVLALVDWLKKDSPGGKVAVMGWGEGGLIALYAAAVDPRIDVTCVSGYFDDRRRIWEEPIDRNVFGLLEQFGDAEVASLIAPRMLIIEASKGPEEQIPGNGGAPARLSSPKVEAVRAEATRARALCTGLTPPAPIELVESGGGGGPCGGEETLGKLLSAFAPGARSVPPGKAPKLARKLPDPAARRARQIHEIDAHGQRLLVESPFVRQEFMKKLDTSSLEAYEKTSAEYRRIFHDEVIGRFDRELLPPSPRSRKAYDKPAWTGWEVVIDVFPGVFAYGVLLVPKDLKAGERRPTVVCQHGLEGRPRDVIEGDNSAYHDFAAKLAERGYVTFAPQNLYIFGDRFRTLQRKANPLKKSLFSVITPQHQAIVDWLETLDFVDPKRIGFYGLSYGGKTAMRVPALVTDYRLSICSADFNEWVWKNASTRSPYSYVWTGEYEIFEFDLGSTFNYAEMAALIAPRPFMVERGHSDGVAPDETVGYEFAKVRHLYEARLGIGDRCELEWFVGPHTIHGVGTFAFLDRHLGTK